MEFRWTQTSTIDIGAWMERVLPRVAEELSPFEDILCEEVDTPELPPVLDDGAIRFNGKGEDGHATFVVYSADHRAPGEPPGGPFNRSCETAGKPYSRAVYLALIVLSEELGDDLDFHGAWEGGEQIPWDELVARMS